MVFVAIDRPSLSDVSDIAICFSVLAGAVVLFVWNKLPVEVVALGAALTLWATGVLTIEQSIAGFGETTVLFIAALFVVSEGLDATGVTAWAGQQLIEKAGTSQTRLVILTMLLVALLTSLISVNGAVAALVPMVVVLAVRLGRSPSQLLMPVAFAAHAGSMLALTGEFSGTFSFGTDTVSSKGGLDVFLAAIYQVDGEPASAIGGGGSQDETAQDVAVGSVGAYMVGSFRGVAEFLTGAPTADEDGVQTITSQGNEDVLIWQGLPL